ncbi:DUF6417 family protein [Streptomyces sp. CA-106110]|uniref:DUF6417 family protein n=1 Tax=Streptomyces sp. CA-106110 TaxID=3240044 RepID=UPI003D915F52
MLLTTRPPQGSPEGGVGGVGPGTGTGFLRAAYGRFPREAHDLLRLLVAVAQAGGLMSREAARLARGIAACIPSENCRIARMNLDRGPHPRFGCGPDAFRCLNLSPPLSGRNKAVAMRRDAHSRTLLARKYCVPDLC